MCKSQLPDRYWYDWSKYYYHDHYVIVHAKDLKHVVPRAPLYPSKLFKKVKLDAQLLKQYWLILKLKN